MVTLPVGALALLAAATAAGGADWRADAEARIERIRKADLKVTVVDGSGTTLPNVPVRVRMKRHAFGFGTAVAAHALLGEGPDNDRYRATVVELFNKAVLENDLKWPQWERNPRRATDALGWLRGHGITAIRGHNLVWPGWKWLPPDLAKLKDDTAALRARVDGHITAEARAAKGLVSEWDVVNEPFSNHDLQDTLGADAMAGWFRRAREADPGAALYINDFGILSGGGNGTVHQDAYFRTIEDLLGRGAPLDGIGMQGHFDARLTPPEKVQEILDRFARLGRRIQVTEFDLDIDDENLQAEYTRDFLTAVFSHPAVQGFLMWGFWEDRHWRPKGAMFRRDWSVKPNGEAYRDLVFHRWWTDVEGITAEDGTYRARGFLGEYEVQAGTTVVRATLPAGGREITVEVR
jgi:endo-1,4-beta-xylanase